MSIHSLDDARKKKEVVKLTPKVIREVPVSLSSDHDRSIQEFTARWNHYAAQNKLNKLFSSDLKVPSSNYLENVSDILEVERNLKVRLAVMPSDFINPLLEESENGRAVLFKFGTVLISTPYLPTEEQARMFALLLLNKLNSY